MKIMFVMGGSELQEESNDYQKNNDIKIGMML